MVGSTCPHPSLWITVARYFRVYYHTLALTINGSSLALPGTTRFRPARHSGTPNTIEMQFDLPAHSTALITFQFEKVFLPIKDFPYAGVRRPALCIASLTVRHV